MAIKEQLQKSVETIKESWAKLTPKVKKIIKLAAGGILTASILLVVALNYQTGKMKVLFPLLSSQETMAVYNVLSEKGVTARINSSGEIEVPEDQWGELQLQLAGEGYPKSAPTYDFFLTNGGFTKTESEKRQAIIYQTEQNIRDSLMQTKGVKNAAVILSLPEQNGYVWEANEQKSSASVTITMESGQKLTDDRVLAVKNLVAFSVLPQMDPTDVKVIDAATGVELIPDEAELAGNGLSLKRLEFERKVQRNIEDNIKRLLSPMYGPDGVTAVASVTLDYDKMLTEEHQVIPQDNGDGVKYHLEESYTMNGNVPAGGLVGEEQNTDIPSYPNEAGEGDGSTTDYMREIDWENSYINTQIEKGQAVIKEVTVSVLVSDPDFNATKRDSLIELVSKSVNIRPESISVQNYVPEAQPTGGEGDEGGMNRWVLIALITGGVLLLILLIVFLVIFLVKRNKKKLIEVETEKETKIHDLQAEIEAHKRELREQAEAETGKETAITNEVRKFAKDNPEITAGLIRSMLKGDE